MAFTLFANPYVGFIPQMTFPLLPSPNVGIIPEDQVCGTVEGNIQCGLTEEKKEQKLSQETKNSKYFNISVDSLENIFEDKLIDEKTRHMIKNLFEIIDSEGYIKKERDVGILAAACFLYVMRTQDEYARITLTEMCSKINCSKVLLKEYLKFVEFYCSDGENPQSKNVGIRNVEESVCEIFSRIGVQEICQKYNVNQINFLRTTLQLVKLADSCWIVTGRPLEGIIIVCAYFGFVSVLHKPVLPFNQFCFVSGLPYFKCREPFTEIKRMILILSKPLSRKTLNGKTCIFHISTILKKSHILRKKVFGKVDSKETFDRLEYALYRLHQPVNKKLISKSVEATENRFASNAIEAKNNNDNLVVFLILNG
ncbi:hypothetical protein TNCT_6651 [Trichonephila clavata]|uniref:BRF2-like C-terminal domain-containing protein n=1 Tax=Trichonephila clavata TaxID=2740835 RepID=A0A8X6GW30_TRICU|nr:hypothetical protein TNCT_6651 [Trichonephila clavata]